jgi:tetratricopeptide (TPR) repeat protein
MSNPSPQKVKVRLNRNPTLWLEGQGQPINIRGLGRVLLYLVLLQGESATRSGMARQLWPGEPDEVAANRLRVSLNRVKALFGSALFADRRSVQLSGVSLQLDLQEKLAELQEVFDEVDPNHQFHLLKGFAEDIREVSWRDFSDLDSSGVLKEWDQACRTAISRLMDHAVQTKEWEAVDFVWDLMCRRGELDPLVCERLLDAFSARGSVEEGLRKVRAAAAEAGVQESDAVFQSLKKYSRTLKESGPKNQAFQTAHFSLLGGALLNQIDRHAEGLAALIVMPEVQLHMQAVPSAYLQILEATISHLEPGSATWIDVQAARLSVYASLYDNEGVFEVCQALFPCELTPIRASMIRMHYSFSLFQLRQWDEAISSIHLAQQLALQGGETSRYEICLNTEAAYLWHLGRVDEACKIYDEYLAKHAESPDFTMRVNGIISRLNYAIIELTFGEISKAKHHAEFVYGERLRFSLSRVMPSLLCLLGVINARTDEVNQGILYAIDGLKLTYARSSSREGQINMEWASGILVVGGLRHEAWQVMNWVNEWRKETHHTRSVCEQRYADSLGLHEFAGSKPLFTGTEAYREVMRFLIKCLRRVQNSAPSATDPASP